jgi:serine/threonine-protein kinase
MAAIYLAKIAGPAGFEKPLALKVIHSHLVEDDQFVQMFFDEARIASQLQHPNIVHIFELGEHEGIYFIAMEYLRGETVGSVIQRVTAGGSRLVDPRVACHIMMEASEGLQYAHELTTLDGQPLRLVHRDISPQNLFVTYSGTVKLMDFGIARAVGLAHSTRPGSLKGKFSYMSPEQVRGLDIDARSDIFALGVVLWEMLTGRRLFKGRNDLESLRLAGDAKFVPVGQMRSGIPPELDRVLARALAREPQDRYQSTLDLHTELGIVAERLGSPMSTHELGGWMRNLFPEELEKKRQLLASAVPGSGTGAGAGASAPPVFSPPSIESTPSVSEPSGIRIRELAGLGEETNQTTPSHSGAWAPAPAAPDPAIRDTMRTEAIGLPPTEIFQDQTEPSKSIADFQALTPRRGLWVALLGGGMLATAAIAVGVVFLLGYLAERGDRREAPTADAPASVVASGVGGGTEVGSADAGPTQVVTPPTATADAGRPVDATATDGALPTTSETVTLRLEIEPANARVAAGGVPQPDASSISLPRSDEPVTVVVSAPGYQPATLRITPDHDATERVSLRRRPQEPVAPTKRPRRGDDLIPSPYSSH